MVAASPEIELEVAPSRRYESTLRRKVRSVGRWRDIIVPATVFVLIALTCWIWPAIYPLRSPTVGSLSDTLIRPGTHGYLLGTDALGIDQFSRLLYGGRVSIEVGFGAMGIGLVLGGTLGAIAGFYSGPLEAVIMRTFDMFFAFPPLVLALVIANYLGPSELHVIWAISFVSVPSFARLSRAATLAVRDQTFVLASSLLGTKARRTLRRHVVPNALPSLVTFACINMATAIVVEAALSFLGLGIPQPGASWGNMIASGESYLAKAPWLIFIPSGAIFLTVMSLNMLGDALRARWGTL